MDRKEMEYTLRKVLGWEKCLAAEEAQLHRLQEKMDDRSAIRTYREQGKDHMTMMMKKRKGYQEQMEECYQKIEEYKAAIWCVHRLLLDALEEDERKLIMLRCLERLNWTQIEFRFPFGRSQCFRLYKRALEKLCLAWEKEGQSIEMITSKIS